MGWNVGWNGACYSGDCLPSLQTRDLQLSDLPAWPIIQSA